MGLKIVKYLALIFSLVFMGLSIYIHQNISYATDKNKITLFTIGFIFFIISFYSILKHPNDEF